MSATKIVIVGAVRRRMDPPDGGLSSLHTLDLMLRSRVTSSGTTVQEDCSSGGSTIHDIACRLVRHKIGLGMASSFEPMPNIPSFWLAGSPKGELCGDVTVLHGLQGALLDPTVGKNGMAMRLLFRGVVETHKASRELQNGAPMPTFKRFSAGTVTVGNLNFVSIAGKQLCCFPLRSLQRCLPTPILAELKAWAILGGTFKTLSKLFGNADMKPDSVDCF
ncbi:hypothetical protein CGC20_20965 [Leishmania donovani]|uniref:Uncharacterized protein n=1 Tax=Leishmania donovani TaxID=5661 RepID=A0A504XE74_LEIDO|nr:hypothetical protein CGC20_20965 [Leishmania donovani]